jgi:glycosyltransferase involved in cell wall biosynthesis
MSDELRISVIIPAYWSQGTLPACLDALRRQTRHPDEIIVVNSSPEPETAAIVRRDYREVLFEQSRVRLLPHAARNRGVELAKGDLLVFTDPDCEADGRWLEILVAAFVGGSRCVVGGMDGPRSDRWETGVHLCKFHWLLPGLPSGTRRHASTANASYSRSLWNQIGPFPGDVFGGDGVLSVRAAQAGHAPRFVPEAVVRHHHDIAPLALYRQRFERGREYGRLRLQRETETPVRTWLSLLASPATLPWVMLRAGRDAVRAGWTRAYLATWGIQALGHLLWALGESRAALDPARQPR